MKKSILFLIAIFFAAQVISQDCGVYHPTKVGTKLSYTYYQKPNKPESTSSMTIINKENTANGLKLDVSGVASDKNGKETLNFAYSAWCDGETFLIDMKSSLSTMSVNDLSNYKIESTNLQFPKNMVAGQKLPDASIALTIDGPVKTGITSSLTNRKVEGFETITTSAGSFECVKISYEYNSKVMFIKTSGKVIEWYALNVGMVKTETYDSKGKLIGTNLLTSLN
jgi:hypothetical protein